MKKYLTSHDFGTVVKVLISRFDLNIKDIDIDVDIFLLLRPSQDSFYETLHHLELIKEKHTLQHIEINSSGVTPTHLTLGLK